MSILQRGKNSWRIEVVIGKVDNKYERITETFHGLKSEAKAREVELKHQIKNGIIRVNKNLTFQEFSKKWLKEYASNLAPRTYSEYEKLLKKINQSIGRIPLTDLRPLQLTEYYNHLRNTDVEIPKNKQNREQGSNKKLSENTVLHHYNLINGILSKAVDWECIERNPNSKVPRPKLKKHEPKFYDTKQVKKLLSCLENECLKYQALILLALDTGARRGEITGLTWSDIDFNKSTININKTTQYTKELGIFEKSTKTSTSNRIIYISKTTLNILKKYQKEQLENKLRLGDKWGNSKRVFTTDFGADMHPDTPSQIFERIIKRHNLKRISLHSLRHTSISLLISSGIQAQIISRRAGHSNVTVTHSIYSHFFDNEFQDVANKMDVFLQVK